LGHLPPRPGAAQVCRAASCLKVLPEIIAPCEIFGATRPKLKVWPALTKFLQSWARGSAEANPQFQPLELVSGNTSKPGHRESLHGATIRWALQSADSSAVPFVTVLLHVPHGLVKVSSQASESFRPACYGKWDLGGDVRAGGRRTMWKAQRRRACWH
jgi:hypothetical protein